MKQQKNFYVCEENIFQNIWNLIQNFSYIVFLLRFLCHCRYNRIHRICLFIIISFLSSETETGKCHRDTFKSYCDWTQSSRRFAKIYFCQFCFISGLHFWLIKGGWRSPYSSRWIRWSPYSSYDCNRCAFPLTVLWFIVLFYLKWDVTKVGSFLRKCVLKANSPPELNSCHVTSCHTNFNTLLWEVNQIEIYQLGCI